MNGGKERSIGEQLQAARQVQDPFVRAERVRALGTFRDPQAIEALNAFLDPVEPSMVRTAAAAALGDMADPAAVEPLIRCLADPWYNVRCHAAQGLAQLGDRRATEPLNRRLAGEMDGYAIAALVEALGPLGDESSVVLLLAHSSRYPRRVTNALSQIGPPSVQPLIDALDGRDTATRQVAVAALGRIGDQRAIEPLRRLQTKSRHITLLTTVAKALSDLGWIADSSRAQQLALLAAGEWDDLIRMGQPAIGLLAHALRHQERRVRCGAARSLAEIGAPQAVPALIKCFQVWKHKDRSTRRAIAGALGQLEDRRATETLLDFVSNENPRDWDEPLDAEIAALGRIGDVCAVQPLIDVALSDRWSNRRREAIEGLGAWQDARTVAALLQLLQEPDLVIRRCAALGLEAQNWQPSDTGWAVAFLVAAQRWSLLDDLGARAVPILLQSLRVEPPEIQTHIVLALGRIGDLRTAPDVLTWLFAHPASIEDPAECERWTAEVRPLLGSYARLVIEAACYARREQCILRDTSSITEIEYTYDLSAGRRAIAQLAALETPIATNVLLLIAQRADAIVDVHYDENEWGGGMTREPLDLSNQRELARRALARRTNANPDPAAYLVRKEWTLPDQAAPHAR